MNDWQRVSYPVSSGVIFFKWEYSKNTTVSSGEDCAWVDYIVLPFVNTASAYAGPDQLVCETGVCMLEGQAINYNSFEWSTIGDGSFDDPEILDPVYTPGPEDISIGEVFLTLATTFNQSGTTFDEMHLSIDGNPGIPEMPSGPEYVDLLTTLTSDYSTALLPNIAEYEWMLEPAEAGTIDGSNENVIITWNQSFNGQVYVSVRAIDSCGPGVFSSALEVMVNEGGLGLSEVDDDIKLSVYPNPVSGILNILVNMPRYGVYEMILTNANGTRILQKRIQQTEGTHSEVLNLESYPEGMYFLQLIGDSFMLTKKVIVLK